MTISPDDIEISFFRSSGPGGQKKNVTESSVRVRHLPTGLVVVATESRSQYRNKLAALAELERRLALRNQRRKKRVATRPTLASRRQRIEKKKKRSHLKKMRARPRLDD